MAKKKDNTEQEAEKTIEELAREAMAAIKESQKNEERELERELKEELKRKEEALKNEAERKIKRKLRRLEKEEEAKPKLDEVDLSFMVSWTNKDGTGFQYIGEYNEKPLFKISRGINLFHLKVISEDVHCDEWRKNSHTSVNLHTLKSKADKMLKESNKIEEEIKKKEKQNPPKK